MWEYFKYEENRGFPPSYILAFTSLIPPNGSPNLGKACSLRKCTISLVPKAIWKLLLFSIIICILPLIHFLHWNTVTCWHSTSLTHWALNPWSMKDTVIEFWTNPSGIRNLESLVLGRWQPRQGSPHGVRGCWWTSQCQWRPVRDYVASS